MARRRRIPQQQVLGYCFVSIGASIVAMGGLWLGTVIAVLGYAYASQKWLPKPPRDR